jgi:hypothetical protein
MVIIAWVATDTSEQFTALPSSCVLLLDFQVCSHLECISSVHQQEGYDISSLPGPNYFWKIYKHMSTSILLFSILALAVLNAFKT